MKTHSKIIFRLAALCFALLCAAATTARADWNPPESSVTPPAVLTLDAFTPPDWYGANPSPQLALGPDGALYGSTFYGGTGYNPNYYSGYGTLFRLEANGTSTKLHDFNGTDGLNPFVPMIVGPDGALYGSTYYGGTGDNPAYGGNGILFRLATNGTFTKLHDFNGTDGDGPSAALVVGPDGALYGSTRYGGTSDNGTLFRLETKGTFTKLHDFNGTDGSYPDAALVVGPDRALYGWTPYGGISNNGTLFRLETNGAFTKLHDFKGTDGSSVCFFSSRALIIGPDGRYMARPNMVAPAVTARCSDSKPTPPSPSSMISMVLTEPGRLPRSWSRRTARCTAPRLLEASATAVCTARCSDWRPMARSRRSMSSTLPTAPGRLQRWSKGRTVHYMARPVLAVLAAGAPCSDSGPMEPLPSSMISMAPTAALRVQF